MADHEGVALHLAARRAARSARGPLVEVGAYRGRSTLYIAAGIAAADGAPSDPSAITPGSTALLYSIDHHHGSEEMQAGWEHHDASLVDATTGRMDSLPSWRSAIGAAGAEDLVVAVVGDSAAIGRDWAAPVSLVLLDGGHGEEVAWADYRAWARHVVPGGLLVIHDVFPDPADGGRPPFECYLDALSTGAFVDEAGAGRDSLRVLRRRDDRLKQSRAGRPDPARRGLSPRTSPGAIRRQGR